MYPLVGGGKKTRSVLVIARGKILPKKLHVGRKEASLEKKRKLQGGTKTTVLTRKLTKTATKIKLLQKKLNRDEINITAEKQDIKQTLTNSILQFRQERIDQKVAAVIRISHNITRPNVHESHTCQHRRK